MQINALSANPTKWSNSECVLFQHFVGLVFRGLNYELQEKIFLKKICRIQEN